MLHYISTWRVGTRILAWAGDPISDTSTPTMSIEWSNGLFLEAPVEASSPTPHA